MTDDPRPFMRLAVDEAARSPADGARVGAVLVRHGVVLVTGHKGEDGTTKHAEAVALEKAAAGGIDVRGATAFVTLEPCANIGSKRTCCAELLADAGINTVYIGRYDRMYRINRQGWKALRDRGIRCRDLQADFRGELDELNQTFDGFFLRRNGLHGTARFDHRQNGGRYELRLMTIPQLPCGPQGGRPEGPIPSTPTVAARAALPSLASRKNSTRSTTRTPMTFKARAPSWNWATLRSIEIFTAMRWFASSLWRPSPLTAQPRTCR